MCAAPAAVQRVSQTSSYAIPEDSNLKKVLTCIPFFTTIGSVAHKSLIARMSEETKNFNQLNRAGRELKLCDREWVRYRIRLSKVDNQYWTCHLVNQVLKIAVAVLCVAITILTGSEIPIGVGIVFGVPGLRNLIFSGTTILAMKKENTTHIINPLSEYLSKTAE